ncbi:MAG: oligoendopeptidase F [Clostridiales Family XIII bacterium]|jgi:oligoendopeptidase F|nr:oligoendopeptidase F [Clostridiales Family XIII bacterium]
MAKKREDIASGYKWAIDRMYADEKSWSKELAAAGKLAEKFKIHEGVFTQNAEALLAALRDRDKLWQKTERVYVYARMRRDEDNRSPKYQEAESKAAALLAKTSAAMAFFEPEFLTLPEGKVASFVKEKPELKLYGHLIKRMLRQKAHVLSGGEEEIMARLGEVLGATGDIFTMINDADMKFGKVKNETGRLVELTHGNFSTFMESRKRSVRKQAYGAMYDAYIKQENTLASAYSYNTKTGAVTASIRKYPSALAQALSPDNVNTKVYENLIMTVGEHLSVLHKYMKIKSRILKLDKLEMYDMYVPLIRYPERRISFEKAVAIMGEALAPLGEDYKEKAVSGALGGWIDVYENEGKSSGAYSFGSYDSDPYILMNFSGKMKDVFTLVHEMGHSMHSHYTRAAQPFVYGGHSIFTAEVASTVNENLLVRHLMRKAASEKERAYYIWLYLEGFRTTLFRQTMFAEFEKLTHETVESGEVLTAAFLAEEYGKLNSKYHGKAVVTDERIAREWSRIPHFYRAFYVYKYATGFSAAAALSERIMGGGDEEVSDYMRFLSLGDSADPIDLLKIAGIDMSKPEPIAEAIKTFGKLVREFDRLTK